MINQLPNNIASAESTGNDTEPAPSEITPFNLGGSIEVLRRSLPKPSVNEQDTSEPDIDAADSPEGGKSIAEQ
jgi:hypothetical protein